jgi:hypothetical protein
MRKGYIMHHLENTEIDKQTQECIQNCLDCYAICTNTVQHCLQMGGKHSEYDHIRTLLDCAEICSLSAGYMLRQSPMHAKTCEMCANQCVRCAESCEKIGADDAQMKACAKMCRTCAESCRQMAGH